MDVFVDYVHQIAAVALKIIRIYSHFVLARFPHAQIFLLGSNSINAAVRIYDLNQGKPKLYWLHSFLWVLLNGFGGGFVSPLLIGQPSTPITNDLILPICIAAWYCTNYLGMYNFFTWMPVKVIWSVFLAIFRTHLCCDMVDSTIEIVSPGPYYPSAIIGPIFTGTAVGTVSQFFPLDAGLSPVAKGTPWTMQGAFLSSFFYHVLVHDHRGFIGCFFRGILGTHSRARIRVCIASMHLVTLVFQLHGPAISLDKKISGTVGWTYASRIIFEKWMNWLRFLFVLLVLGGHIYLTRPPAALHPGSKILVGESIGTCQFFSPVKLCNPYILALEAQRFVLSTGETEVWSTAYRIATYSGTVLPAIVAGSGQEPFAVQGKEKVPLRSLSPVWSRTIKYPSSLPRQDSKHFAALKLDPSGVLQLIFFDKIKKIEIVIWESNRKCTADDTYAHEDKSKVKGLAELVGLVLDSVTGFPVIRCSDGSILTIDS